ncbi:hypothetical protein FGIG_11383 [Fasciola gigantica]|uniref:Uncharacterized protein n=1 Tax=Fasciola gigantica TaxID=46835 RepID=A0A504YR58_FASGI|nr:hypothetical protein FGIG_11383 [Fasciola gigantica]
MRSIHAPWTACGQSAFLYFQIIIMISRVVLSMHSEWMVSAHLNPDCLSHCELYNLIYVNAKNQSTSIHTFIDASFSSPSVLLVHSSDPDARPNFNWTTLFSSTAASESIQIPNVTQSYALTFLSFMLSNSDQRNPLMPQLSFIPGLSLQIELALDNLVSQYNRGRFGLQLALLSNATLFNDEDYVLKSVFRIDDESTPGNFETININLGKIVVNNTESHVPENNPEPPAFIQTRPISYTSGTARNIKNSRNAKVAQFRNVTTKMQRTYLRKTIPFYFYGDRFYQQFNSIRSRETFYERFLDTVPSPVGIRLQNVSFGTTEDGFYKASGYIVW